MTLAETMPIAKPKRTRKKKAQEPEQPPAPQLPTQCAQCGKQFDYRDRIYHGEQHGLCNKCRQMHTRFLLKGQYQRITSKDGQVTPNVARGLNRSQKRFQDSTIERMQAAERRGDHQTFHALERQLKARGLMQ